MILDIDKEFKKKSGIYLITNKITGNFYIGSAANFSVRWQKHKRDMKKLRHSAKINKDVIEYGSSSFFMTILELCSEEKLIKMEQWYLDSFRPYENNNYNTSKIAQNTIGKIKRENIIKIISPEGKEHYFKSLKAFARKNELDPAQLLRVIKGENFLVKGWHMEGYKCEEPYKFLSPNGEYHEIKHGGLAKFCKKYNLKSPSQLGFVWSGRLNSYCGWVRYDEINNYEIICNINTGEERKIYKCIHFPRSIFKDIKFIKSLLQGKRLLSGEWFLKKNTDKILNKYKFINKEGEIIGVHAGQSGKIAKELGLKPQYFLYLLLGRISELNGYKRYEENKGIS